MRPVRVTGAAVVMGDELDAALARLPDAVQVRARRAERVTQLAIAGAGAALAEADLGGVEGPPRPGIGIALGTAFGCFLTNAAYQRRVAAKGARAASPRLFAATVSNAAAGEVSIAYHLGGPAVTLTAGTAAGLFAIGHAADLLASGQADAMVAGGMDACGAELESWIGDGGLATGDAAVRDAAVALVLEPEQATRGRALVLGHGAGLQAGGTGAKAAVRRALAEAGVAPSDIAAVAICGAGADAVIEPALEGIGSERVIRPRAGVEETLAAAGPRALLDLLAATPAGVPALVIQACPSGHVAVVVVARMEAP
jgi:3-oxoacyl-[acyl-carrier-protein] synthase II